MGAAWGWKCTGYVAATVRVCADPDTYLDTLQVPYPSKAGWRVRRGSQVAAGSQDQVLVASLDLADNWFGVLRLQLTVFSDNASAIGLYERMEFERDDLPRGYAFRHWRCKDALMMARWPQLPPER